MRPDAYHGDGWAAPFFEGWYFKLVDRARDRRIAIIPGVYRGVDPSESHAFIQVFDGTSREAHYIRYPLADFHASSTELAVRIGESRFSTRGLELAIETPELVARGAIDFGTLSPWPVRVAAPGIMGWYAWVPLMECYHGVVSLDHSLSGRLDISGRSMDFTDGYGYIEKDWGRSFPTCWVWTQTNHLVDARGTRIEGASLTASIAEIPWRSRTFPGFIVGLLFEGTLYRFATYNYARVTWLEVTDDEVIWRMRRGSLELDLTIKRAQPTTLPGPTIAGMKREVHETLDARVELVLRRRRGRSYEPLLRAEGHAAGLEVQGPVERLFRRARP